VLFTSSIVKIASVVLSDTGVLHRDFGITSSGIVGGRERLCFRALPDLIVVLSNEFGQLTVQVVVRVVVVTQGCGSPQNPFPLISSLMLPAATVLRITLSLVDVLWGDEMRGELEVR
jgi:hypothetical protein